MIKQPWPRLEKVGAQMKAVSMLYCVQGRSYMICIYEYMNLGW